MRAAIYCRLSSDASGEGAAVERQEQDCRALAADRGWSVEQVFADNDLSAFNTKVKRPAFAALLEACRVGDFETVIVWRTDRLARRGKDLQLFLNACEPNGCTLTSVTEPDFVGATGLLMLRILSGFAEHESSVKSERVARAAKAQAEQGEPHRGGRRVFGYTRNFTPHAKEAALIQEAVKRTLFGDTSTAIVREWRERGVLTVSGKQWSVSNFTRMLRAPVLAGLRSYRGELIEGNWKALIDRSDWDLLQSILAARHVPQKRISRHLLTGLARCGECDNAMHGAWRGKLGFAEYRCDGQRGGCGHVIIRAEILEREVERRLLEDAPAIQKAQREAGKRSNKDLAAQLRELDADTAALDDLHAARFVERTITAQAFTKAKAQLEQRIEQRRGTIAGMHAVAPLTDLAIRWPHGSVTWKRQVLDAVVERIIVSPGRKDRVSIEWRLRV